MKLNESFCFEILRLRSLPRSRFTMYQGISSRHRCVVVLFEFCLLPDAPRNALVGQGSAQSPPLTYTQTQLYRKVHACRNEVTRRFCRTALHPFLGWLRTSGSGGVVGASSACETWTSQ